MNKKCTALLTKGIRKSELCNRKILNTYDIYCRCHMEQKDLGNCQIVLIKGIRKNQICNKKIVDNNLCRIHKNIEDMKPHNPYLDNESDVTFDDTKNIISKITILEKKYIYVKN